LATTVSQHPEYDCLLQGAVWHCTRRVGSGVREVWWADEAAIPRHRRGLLSCRAMATQSAHSVDGEVAAPGTLHSSKAYRLAR
jgi:hypothetical protein